METKLNNIEIAIVILRNSKKEMHVNEIAEKAVAQGMVSGFSVEEFAKKLSTSLSLNVKRNSPIARVKNRQGGNKRGVYRLKKQVQKELTHPVPEPEQIEDTGFVGKAGEYAVMSELLFRGFNASLMSVDKGIDVVAANDQGKYFHIQVKTANLKSGVFNIGIKRKSFELHHSGQTFYIFVLRQQMRCDFLVMPNSQIANYVALGIIKGADTLSIRISYDLKSKKYSMNGGQDATVFVNRFGQIC